MIKISSDDVFMPTRSWNTRQDLNSESMYVLTADEESDTTWDVYLRPDGGCRLVQWSNKDPNSIYESSIMVSDLRTFITMLEEVSELAEGYFDNDAWGV